MSACKTLARTSLSCLEFQARTPNSTTLRHFTSSLSLHSGLRIKTQRPFSISRSFASARGAVPLETSDCTEGTAPHNVSLRTPQDSCKDTVQELLSKDKDDISRDAYLSCDEILEGIDPYIMESRKERFRNVVNNRSYSVSLVVEGLSDFGNVSAAFRSADALGIQSVHVVSCDSSKRYRDNRHVSMGAEKWLDIELWSSIKECFGILKARGYRIATTHLGVDAVSVYDVDWSHPTAIVVGNELRGISEEALKLSDLHCSIPMRGMVDSFNVSVAAGLLMHQAVCDRTLRMGCHGDLTQEERQILLAEFYLRHNKNSLSIANEFSKRKTFVELPA
ncbi:UNVERIFIED_CONTAM: tRNA (guanosine(18)-2'-O)-methyltransferase [Sesamum radiatum]|uniref:tRNA (Guanosine(18)-2'-O)-methyltransferase n=1 Tax=Sesamum radiatum TaxID=300843 RepID=A0AAW2P4U5_SESRA